MVVARSMLLWLIVAIGYIVLPSLVAADEIRPTDPQMELQIQEQVRSDIRLRDAKLKIVVVAGVVTLKGELPSFSERSRVERLCNKIAGVKHVNNRIMIAAIAATDDDLQHLVQRRLASDPYLRSSRVHVEVDRSSVTLSGEVNSLNARRRAQWLIEQVRGVSRVRNELKLVDRLSGAARTASDNEILAAITDVVGEDKRLGQAIQFSVKDGVVVLHGQVSSVERKRFYRELIQRIRGVRQVENLLEVVYSSPIALRENANSIDDAATDIKFALETLLPSTAEDLHTGIGNDGIVISGTIPSLSQKQRVLRLAKAFGGRFRITDRIEIAISEDASPGVKTKLEEALASDVLLSDYKIGVTVNDGVVSLTGSVSRYADKTRATRIAATLPGVRSVENKVVVSWSPTLSDEELRESVQNRLARNRVTASVIDAIEVTVMEGRVTLSGQVTSWELRRQISQVALQTDGIRSIQNQIGVKLPD